MVKARSPGKDGQSMACRKAMGIYAVVTVSSPSMIRLSCHSYIPKIRNYHPIHD